MADINMKELAGALAEAMALASKRPPVDIQHSPDEYEKTGVNTHRATERGYAKGELIEPGEFVPDGVPIGSWMEEIDPKSAKRERAVQEATADHPGDVDLTQVGMPGLRAMAAERGINPKGLSEADLIAAIKAEREPTI